MLVQSGAIISFEMRDATFRRNFHPTSDHLLSARSPVEVDPLDPPPPFFGRKEGYADVTP